jgi:hypothetical protein
MGLTQHPLSEASAVLVGLAALVVVFLDVGWSIARHPGVMAHEGAHAVAGWLMFRKIGGITMDAAGNGATLVERSGCLGSVVSFFAGYVGPSLFGLGAARLI